MSLALIKGEKVLKKTNPHIFAMFHLYLTWLYLAIIGLVMILFKQELLAFFSQSPLGKQGTSVLLWTTWSLLIFIPAAIVSFLRINWYWLLLAILLIVSGMYLHQERQSILKIAKEYWQSSTLQTYTKDMRENWPIFKTIKNKFNPDEISNYWIILIGLGGLISANSYRRSHRYYITNRRVIIRFGFIITRERDLLYSKIEDLILHRDVLGKLFNFGTLIPISASGIGTGSDQAILMVGAQQKLPVGPSLQVTMGGGHSVTVPRAPSFYSLYGIPNPEGLRTIMLQEMERREYLRRKDDTTKIIKQDEEKK